MKLDSRAGEVGDGAGDLRILPSAILGRGALFLDVVSVDFGRAGRDGAHYDGTRTEVARVAKPAEFG